MNHAHVLPTGELLTLPFRADGRQRKKISLKTPCASDFLDRAKSWPAVKPRGWEYAVNPKDLEMLGNDERGCCVEAALMHFIQVETANTGTPLHGTKDQTLALYSAVTGFDPRQDQINPLTEEIYNPTDKGTVMLDFLNYVLRNGVSVTDANGRVVKWTMEAFAALDVSSVAQRRWVSDVFGGTLDGIWCPKSAVDNVNNWTWDPRSIIVGGHGVNGAGQGGAGGHEQSWGKNIPYTWEFMMNVLDESYLIVSTFWLNQQQKSPSGFDLEGLIAASKKV